MPIIRWPRFGAGSGSITGSDPNVCTLTISDNGDGTGGVATIGNSSGGATNTLYGAIWTAGTLTWTSIGSRSGNGTITLTSQGSYLWYVGSSLAGFSSASQAIYKPLTNTTGVATDALEDQLADAIVFELVQAGMLWTTLFTTEGTVPYRTRYPIYGDDGYYASTQLATLKISVVPVAIARTRLARGGNGRELVYDIAIDLQRMIEPKDDTNLKKFSRLAEQIHDYFDNGHLVLQQPIGWQGNWQYMTVDREEAYYMDTLKANRIWETLINVKVRGFKP